MLKLLNVFIYTSSVMLFLTAVAKLISSCGDVAILQEVDSVLLVSYRTEFIVVAVIEFIVVLCCFISMSSCFKLVLIAWLATCFIVYRLGLLWVGSESYCPCLGNLTDTIGISTKFADIAMKVLLFYLFVGSYTLLTCLWLDKRSQVK